MALSATSSYYDVTEIATRILPNIVVFTIDPDRYSSLKYLHLLFFENLFLLGRRICDITRNLLMLVFQIIFFPGSLYIYDESSKVQLYESLLSSCCI